MDFKSLVLAFVFNLLTIGIPIGIAIYLALSYNIAKHGNQIYTLEDIIKILQNKNTQSTTVSKVYDENI